MDVNELLNDRRQGGADYHVVAGTVWLEAGEPSLLHSPLVYGACEFRCAIERVAFELYYILRDRPLDIEEARALGGIKGVLSKLHEEGGGNRRELYRRLKFNAVYADEQTECRKPLAIPDPGVLHRLWGDLSEYCHAQLMPGETWERQQWIENGYAKLSEVNRHLRGLLVDSAFGALRIDSIPEEAAGLRDKFIREEIDDKSLRIRLRLMKAVIETRPPWLFPTTAD